MNKLRLVGVLKDYSAISKTDIDDLKVLAKSYPYSQLLHGLIAKGSYNHALKDAQSNLHVAAMYVADRKVLKSLILGHKTVEASPQKIVTTKKAEQLPQKVRQDTDKIVSPTIINKPLEEDDADALRAEVYRNLELLVENKKLYDAREEMDITSSPTLKTPKPKTSISKKNTATTKKKTTTVEKKERKTSKSSLPKNAIATNNIELIDEFIKKTPSITKKAKQQKSSAQEDLSEPSGQFGDDLMSENLAQILTRQGKKDKAIDIYKKLIWKFPQKKAYFATQIEALKK